jgi:hypothetical protein
MAIGQTGDGGKSCYQSSALSETALLSAVLRYRADVLLAECDKVVRFDAIGAASATPVCRSE